MLISGFTFVRNAQLLGYPFVQSIRSILPLVDEFVINLGPSVDGSAEILAQLAQQEPKIRIIHSAWNDAMKSAGFVYAQQKMIAQYQCQGEWAFYLEADEVLHEKDIPKIRACLQRNAARKEVEAIAFHYHHFYGNPQQVAVSPAWYRREVRVIRNTIRSYAPDGLFWTVMDKHRKGRYPRAVVLDAHIHHYGWVRSQSQMLKKYQLVEKYWNKTPPQSVDYGNIDSRALRVFSGEHPALMQEWLSSEAQQTFAPNPTYQLTQRERKHRLAMWIEKLLDIDLSKKHFSALADVSE